MTKKPTNNSVYTISKPKKTASGKTVKPLKPEIIYKEEE